MLTHEDVPRIPYTTAGQGWPEPSPYDAVMLDRKVRFVGDRVAVVAAEDPELAQRACEAIEVEYELLPAVFDPERAMDADAPVHPRPDGRVGHQGRRRATSRPRSRPRWATCGRASPQADHVFEDTYRVPYVQQASIEPHIAITWLDEDHRLMVRTSTQVPFHVRRIIAPLLGHPDPPHPRDQAAHRRRLRRQAGDPDRGPVRHAHAAHRPARCGSSTRARRS